MVTSALVPVQAGAGPAATATRLPTPRGDQHREEKFKERIMLDLHDSRAQGRKKEVLLGRIHGCVSVT